jgi:hypothetical protein
LRQPGVEHVFDLGSGHPGGGHCAEVSS